MVLGREVSMCGVCFKLIMSLITELIKGAKTNLTKEFQETDRAIQKIRWKTYGPQKLFDTKLRFRIRLDDFRGYLVTSIEEGNADEQTIEEVLEFYNMATSAVLNFLATGWLVLLSILIRPSIT